MKAPAEIPIDLVVERLVAAGKAEKIILFGSRARGTALSRSDYDLLVVQPSQIPRFARARAYYRLLSDLPVEVDIVVVTPEEVKEWELVPQAFITTALREGTTLYERQG